MILMGPAKTIEKYRNLMNGIDVTPEVRNQIIENCAKYSTYRKIRSHKYNIVAVIKAQADMFD